MSKNSTIIYPYLSYRLTGILFSVHNDLGRYCNELQYGDKLEWHLHQNSYKYEREKVIDVSFEGERERRNIADFVIEDRIILEIKAQRILRREHYFQVQRYLRAARMKLGILVNFQEKYLRPRRILNSKVNP